MNVRKALIPTLLAYIFFSFACVYVVLPEGLATPEAVVEGAELKTWNAIVTDVGKSDAGDLHIGITIRNDTGDWSTMHAVEGKPVVLTSSDGKTANCDTVFVSTGGHRLARVVVYDTLPESPAARTRFYPVRRVGVSIG